MELEGVGFMSRTDIDKLSDICIQFRKDNGLT